MEKREIIFLKCRVKGNSISLFDEHSAYHANEVRNFDEITAGRMYICFMVIWPRNDLVSIAITLKKMLEVRVCIRRLTVSQSCTRTYHIKKRINK